MDPILMLTIVGTAATVYCAWMAHKQFQVPTCQLPGEEAEED